MTKPHFYEVLQEVPAFVEEAKGVMGDPAFTTAVDNFLANNNFSSGAALTSFYMANRGVLDALVQKHAPDTHNARTATCAGCQYNTPGKHGAPETCSILLNSRAAVKNLNVYRAGLQATCPDQRWIE